MSDATVSQRSFAGVSRARLAGRLGGAVAVWICFALIALSAFYPLWFLTATALRTTDDYTASPGGIPSELTFNNISEAFSVMHIGDLALNSLMVVVPSVLLVTAISCLAAYALIHFQFPLRRTALVVIVAMMALPPTALLIPTFKTILDIGLLNDRLGLIIVYVALVMPFSIYLLSSFMRGVPSELLNAARIDGAGALRTLWSVVLPLVRPGLLTLVTLNFLVLWNEFLFSLVLLQVESSRTIMVGIAQFNTKSQENFGLIAAGLMLSMIPPLVIFAFLQRDLARGLTSGAVK
jgi:ABC-type glycerol-3-phosphate transport system permease component